MIFVHIGMARAGSTSIQRFLSTNAPLLRQHGIIAPDVAMIQLAAKTLHTRRPSADEPRWQAMQDILREHRDGKNKILLSSEYFSARRWIRARHVEQFKEAAHGHEVKLVYYLRDSPSWYVSSYSRHTSMGRNTDDIDTFLPASQREHPRPWAESPWVVGFGRDSIRYRALNDLKGRSLAQDYAECAGVTDIPGLDFLSDERVNATPHWMVVELSRFAAQAMAENEAKLHRNDFVEVVRTLSRTMMGSKFHGPVQKAQYLTPDQWIQLRDVYNRDIAAINELFPGHALPLLSSDPPGPRPFKPCFEAIPEEMRQRLIAAASSASYRKQHANIPPVIFDKLATVDRKHASLYGSAGE